MTQLNERAMLVSMSIQSWSARKFDKTETAAIAKHHGTATDVARVNKSLLPNSAELKLVERAANDARTEFYKRTLPWMHAGVAIIKTEGYWDFTGVMRDHKSRFDDAVRAFLVSYPTLQAQAQLALNGMYKDEDYPPARLLASRFRFDVGFMPLPDEADWRVELEGEELERLRTEIRQQMADTEQRAMAEAWQRLYDVVSKTHERLTGVDTEGKPAVFRDTLVSNAVEICALLPSLNLSGDPALETQRQALERAFAGIKPDDLRKDPVVREQVAGDVAGIMAKMAGIYAPRAA